MKSKNKVNKLVELPNDIAYVENKTTHDTTVLIENYNQDKHFFTGKISVKQLLENIDDKSLVNNNYWINLTGLKDVELIHKIGNKLAIHALCLEDVFDVNHRPKIEVHKEYIFISLKIIQATPNDKTINYEQISFFLFPETKNLLTVQEYEEDLFKITRENIKDNVGKVRSVSVDYLLYRLIDVIVDNYSLVTESVMNNIEEIEVEVENYAGNEIIQNIQKIRKDVIKLKKEIFPVREILIQLTKHDNTYLSQETILYFKDVDDHIIAIIDNLNQQKDSLSNILTIYQANVSFKMNEVMQLLTIFSVIFIPLTFIAGVYGTNFKFIPEYNWEYGYLYFWGLIISLALIIVYIFKKRKWI